MMRKTGAVSMMMKMKSKLSLKASCALALGLMLAVLLNGQRATAQQRPEPYDKSLFKSLQWRSIGPFRGGRVTAVAGVPSQPQVYYFGATGGGLWKSTDGGMSWQVVSDGFFKTGSVGAIGICDSDPNVIYVGMGESPVRGNVSHGDGVYKSTDAGKTWKRVGLEDTRQIARVRVHPRNPDLVYVAAQGHIWGTNEQRGIFRSKDGGKTWERVLYRNERTGASDLVFDPTNANILYAAFWDVHRTPWTLESGGPGGGIFKSTDGGDNWTEITRNPGLPKGIIGNIGLAVSASNPERVWAIVEAEDGGVFRSDNGGKTWTKTNEERRLRQRAWYYTRIYADPQNADSVYVLNTGFYRSNDGGKTFSSIPVPHGDNHDLWIAPNDPARMIESNDGGANVSFNGGKSWTSQDQQPTAQFYRVAVDEDFPYHIYGAQQDNTTVKTISRTNDAGITREDWYPVGGGESGWVAPYPKDTEIVFAGSYGGLVTRYDHRTGQLRDVTAWPDNPMGHGAADLKYRFQWNFPLLFSPHDPDTLYAAGNVLFKTTNQGQSWTAISPDLTRNDKSKQGPSGGPITKDNTSIEYYDTIFTVMESPVTRGLIWTGSDDGLVQLTRDGGGRWENVTPKEMPEWIQINSIEASPHDAATAYMAATMYKFDDFRPYLYKTNDYGRTWRKIVNGIPDGAFTRVVREDPNRRGLLYAGTETGIYVSFDDGENWQSLQLNLPIVPITDLVVHKRERDLVAATQGRAFWVLDDLTALHQIPDAARSNGKPYLFRPEDTYLFDGGSVPPDAPVGKNPPSGAVVYYYLKNKPAGPVTLEFLDQSGKLIKKFTTTAPETPPSPPGTVTQVPAAPAASPASASSQPGASPGAQGQTRAGAQGTTPSGAQTTVPPEQPQAPSGEEVLSFGERGQSRVNAEAGLNRFVWDMHYTDATTFPGLILWSGPVRGPRIVPGTYQVRLTADGQTLTQSFEVRKDPRLSVTQADYQKQLDLLLKIRDKLSETHEAIIQIREVRKQVDELVKRLADQPQGRVIGDAAKALNTKMSAIENELYQTRNQSSQDPLNFPIRLNNRLAALGDVVSSADAAPTEQSYAVYDEVVAEIDAQLQKWRQMVSADVPAFNQLVRDQNIPVVIVKPAKKP